MLKHAKDHYASVSILLHWLMLLVIVAAYVFVNLHDYFPKGSDQRALMLYLHFCCGLTVLLLVLIRIAVTLQAGSAPAITPAPARWILTFSKLGHLALYAFMLVMPILGWLTLSTGDIAIPFHLPALMGVDKPLSHNIKDIHETIGEIGYYLIGVHAAAALFHHYFLKDNTLLRMLPARCGKK